MYRLGLDPFNNSVKFDDSYSFIRVVFLSNKRIESNFTNSTVIIL